MMRCFGSLALAKAASQAVYRGKSTSTLLAPIAPGNRCPFPCFRFENDGSLSIALSIWRLLDEDDEHHRDATQILHQLAQARYRQFTTNVLLIESHALILSVLGRAQAAQFLKDMQESNTVIVRVRASDEERAKQILFQYD